MTHYPTGASKWNPIEHLMFNLISANWTGHPLESYETLLKHIRTMRSPNDFRCQARLDTRTYVTRLCVPPGDVARLQVRPHKLFPHWNYTIFPLSPGVTPNGQLSFLQNLTAMLDARKCVLEFLDKALQHYPIDGKRLAILGFSQPGRSNSVQLGTWGARTFCCGSSPQFLAPTKLIVHPS